MITISKPYIETKEGTSFLTARITDDKRKKASVLWFSVDNEFGKYLCDDYADSFLLGLLPIAIKTQQDILIEGAASERLLYNTRHFLEPAFQKILSTNSKISIESQEICKKNYNSYGVGTGCSLGVDSLSTIFRHLEKGIENEYKLSHLTLFNSGQLGDYDLEASEKNFLNTIDEIKPFASKIGLPILAINSNLNSFYKDTGIIVTQTVAIRTIAFAMTVQKLLRHYIMASTYPIDKIKWDNFDAEHQEAAIIPLLESDNFSTFVGDPFASRVDKTAYIIKKPFVSNYLKVCWAEQTAFEVWHNTSFLENKTKVNCGWCDKCLRTLLAIEILNNGKLDEYAEQFELKKYYEYRNQFIKKIFKQRKTNVFYDELVNLIISHNYKKLPYGVLKTFKFKNFIDSHCKKMIKVLLHPHLLYSKVLSFIKR